MSNSNVHNITGSVSFIHDSIQQLLDVEDAIETSRTIEVIPTSLVIDVVANPVTLNVVVSNSSNYTVFTPAYGQTIFTLPTIPLRPDLSIVTVNGVQYYFGIDYMINVDVLTWSGILLENSDIFKIYYF